MGIHTRITQISTVHVPAWREMGNRASIERKLPPESLFPRIPATHPAADFQIRRHHRATGLVLGAPAWRPHCIDGLSESLMADSDRAGGQTLVPPRFCLHYRRYGF